jgi:SAM-dependent methyltransferase
MDTAQSSLAQPQPPAGHAPQRLLSESQNATFDTDYHTPKEFAAKLVVLRQHFGTRPVRLLDAGGGNGVFTDAVLAAMPGWSSTIVDISDHLLAQNAVSPAKRLVGGSIFDLETLLPGERFDMISVNWMLHHLIAGNYRASLDNIVAALRTCAAMLAPDGLLCVGENRYQGLGDSNVPARLIYALTAIEQPQIARLVARHANTAGVGVCFQSEQAWVKLFAGAGLTERYPRFHNHPFVITGLKKWGLLLKTAGKVHFYLTPGSTGSSPPGMRH